MLTVESFNKSLMKNALVLIQLSICWEKMLRVKLVSSVMSLCYIIYKLIHIILYYPASYFFVFVYVDSKIAWT